MYITWVHFFGRVMGSCLVWWLGFNVLGSGMVLVGCIFVKHEAFYFGSTRNFNRIHENGS